MSDLAKIQSLKFVQELENIVGFRSGGECKSLWKMFTNMLPEYSAILALIFQLLNGNKSALMSTKFVKYLQKRKYAHHAASLLKYQNIHYFGAFKRTSKLSISWTESLKQMTFSQLN